MSYGEATCSELNLRWFHAGSPCAKGGELWRDVVPSLERFDGEPFRFDEQLRVTAEHARGRHATLRRDLTNNRSPRGRSSVRCNTWRMDEETRGRLREVVHRRWRIGGILTAVMMAGYFGFILLVAFAKPTAGYLLGDVSVGIVLGAGVIVLAPVLTSIYVRWANRHYDPAVEALRSKGPKA